MAANAHQSSESSDRGVVLDEARRLGLDPGKAYAGGLAAEIARRWQEENADALASSNAWIERNGLPLDHQRLF